MTTVIRSFLNQRTSPKFSGVFILSVLRSKGKGLYTKEKHARLMGYIIKNKLKSKR